MSPSYTAEQYEPIMSGNNIKDYYYFLGLPNNATKEAIKTAYRKLSIKFHPDKNEGDKFFEERFKDIQEAFETLSDDTKRMIYDDRLKTSGNTASSGKTQPGNTPHSRQTAEPVSPISPARAKNKLKQILYGLIALIVFSSPAWLQPIIHYLNEKEISENKTNVLNDTIKKDTVKPDNRKQDTSGDKVILLRVTEDTPVIRPPVTSITTGNDVPDPAADDDGFTAADVINRFFYNFDHNDCHAAWNLTYNNYWVRMGEDWFCSVKAFGGVTGVMVYDIRPITQNNTEAYFYTEYYSEDSYNGNKCFKRNITVQKIEYTDYKSRWRITKMKDNEAPVDCKG